MKLNVVVRPVPAVLAGLLALGAALALAGCEDTLSGPEPVLAEPAPGTLPVEPAIQCRMQHPEQGTPVVVHGSGFSPIPFDIPGHPTVALPTLTLLRNHALDGTASDGTAVEYGGQPGQPNAELLSWQSQSQLTFVVKDQLALADGTGMLPLGLLDVQVVNADGNQAVSHSAFAAVDRPYAVGINPPLLCLAQAGQSVTVAGQQVLRIGDARPTVRIGGTEFPVDTLADCVAIAHPGLDAELCATATVILGQGSLTAGLLDVVFANPAPASCTSVHAEDGVNLRVVPPPTITSIDPDSLCRASAGTIDLTVHGDGFLRINGVDPAVTVSTSSISPRNFGGCTTLDTSQMTVESCTSFVITVDTTGFPTGGVTITVTNPTPADCGASASGLFRIVDPPQITGVLPDHICSDVAETITIQGTGFAVGAAVSAGNVTADSADVNATGTEINAHFNAGLPAGNYDVTVDNGLGCSTTLPNAITVDPTPLVFFVDPPVVYNGISIEVTIFTTGLNAAAASVDLISTTGTVIHLSGFSSPVRANRIVAPVPAGLPPDTYQVQVTSALGCVSSLNGRLVVTANLNIALEAIDPSFVSPTNATAVTVTAVDPAPNGSVQFEAVPRLYLNPNPSSSGTVAHALRAVLLESPSQLSAVVPEGMTPGRYDLIAVNPSGSVGLLPQALTVTAAEPPLVTAVAPGSLDANSVQTVEVVGNSFDVVGVAVAFECQDFASGAPVASGTISVDSATTTHLGLTVDATGVPAGSVCVVVVTNGDGAWYRYSAVSFKEPSQNLNDWASGTVMHEPRRGLSLSAGRPTDTSRYLYAIGGDDGTSGDVKSSVEAAPVDPFGKLGAWIYQRNSLQNAWDGATVTALPRAYAGNARIGRFIYLVGGSDGTAPTSTLLRAQILDPLAGPEILDLDAALGGGSSGLGEGLWFYEVSALFPLTDPSNPGGESLAGEVLNVQLPAVAERIVLTLTWQQVIGASGYRVYRSAVADDTVNNLQLLAEVAGGGNVTLVDTGTTTHVGVTPFPRGSLGVWHAVTGAALHTPRAQHATAAAADPRDPQRWFLYAIGGSDGSGPLATSEYATVTIGHDGSQQVSDWAPIGANLSLARSGLPAFVVTSADTPVVPIDAVYLFVGPGDDGTRPQGIMEVAEVLADGSVNAFIDTGTPRPPAAAGSAGLAANGFLFLFGGRNGSPTNNDWSGELMAPLPGVSLDSGGSLGGGGMLVPRQYQGATQESAFFFIAGGRTSTELATTSVEQTVQ